MKPTGHIHDPAEVALLTLKKQLNPLGGQHGNGPPTHAVPAAGHAQQHLVSAAAAGGRTKLADVGIHVKLFNKSVVLGFSLGMPPFVGMRRQLGCGVGRAPLGGAPFENTFLFLLIRVKNPQLPATRREGGGGWC
jgi:hypothetical protein